MTAANGNRRKDPSSLKLKLGDRFGVAGIYSVCNQRGDTTPGNRSARAIGKGGAGSVYLAKYANSQIRSAKFLTLNYLDDDRTGQRVEDFLVTFQREREFLYSLAHSNITTLHEAGTYRDTAGNDWQYLITEYVAGPMLTDALTQPDLDGNDIYQILRDVISAVAYLNRRGVFHCDIKAANIRLRRAEHKFCEVVLLDWGAAQVLPTNISEQQTALIPVKEDERRRFVSTDAITHPLHKPYLGGKRLTQSDLLVFVPRHELHTLGVLLSDVLRLPRDVGTVRDELTRVIGAAGARVLDEIVADLMQAPEVKTLDSAEDLAADFEKLHRNYLSPAGTPELSLAAEFQFSTPTATGRAPFTPRLGRVAYHKLVQRLRDIPQLEYTFLKFAGATHTRLSHSEAVLNNCRFYLAHLLNDARFRRLVEPNDLQATLLLGLLHDAGHYQLSHMFEDLATSQRSASSSDFWRSIPFDIPTDDDLFPYILGHDDKGGAFLRGGYGEAISEAVERSRDLLRLPAIDQSSSLSEVIEADFGSATLASLRAIHGCIYSRDTAKKHSAAHRVLGAVISSDIDADKTAYLVEDSANTGVAYGNGIDLDGILGNLCMPSSDDLSVAHKPIIGLNKSGVTAAQSVAVNRNQMLSQVYWNQSNRAATAMIKYSISRLFQAGQLDMRDYLRETLFASREEALKYLFDRHMSGRSDVATVPMAGLMQAERRVYQRIFEASTPGVEDSADLNDKLIGVQVERIIELEDRLSRELRVINGLSSLRPGQIIVDVPSKERERASGDRGGRVYVYDDRPAIGKGRPLVEETAILKSLKEQHRQLNRISRVFLAPHLFEAVGDLRALHARVEEIIRETVGM